MRFLYSTRTLNILKRLQQLKNIFFQRQLKILETGLRLYGCAATYAQLDAKTNNVFVHRMVGVSLLFVATGYPSCSCYGLDRLQIFWND